MTSATLVSVVGARPQLIKLAPVSRALSDLTGDWTHRVIHTGQHYDYAMSEIFLSGLEIPPPDVNLGIGSGKHGQQTAAMVSALEQQFETLAPDGVIVYGDTNSTLAATIAASKLPLPLFHVEAGLRSFDRTMPEEVNRIVTDHCAELLFAPTSEAMINLEREGLANRAVQVGDVMYDAVLFYANVARENRSVLAGLNIKANEYFIATIHRPASTDGNNLAELIHTLCEIAKTMLPVVFPVHPRTRAILSGRPEIQCPGLLLIEPQGYLDMLSLVQNARMVLTDSGGLQKEAAFLGTPCVTLRDSTEWTETIEIGANRLAGLAKDRILAAVRSVFHKGTADWSQKLPTLYGEGRASEKIVTAIDQWFKHGNAKAGTE
jgi:UDP-N-acetylglucosamine 2-epimerase